MVGNVYKKKKSSSPIYGAEWAGTSNPAWTRTDAAANFSDPNPYYAGMSGIPSSPFDNIMPWAGMRKVYNAEAGWLVEMPKFYYKWTRNGIKMKIQLSMTKHNGFLCSPAHADRGDGIGERDYVYVGRYHCASDYKSKTGVTPIVSMPVGNYRTNIHNLGSYVLQLDYALFWTISMLYLVEYANWDAQTVIGYGCGESSLMNTGSTDTMPYHTGTIKTSRATYGVGVQYRYIEDWWANSFDIVDGCFYNNSNQDVYGFLNPFEITNDYMSHGTKIGHLPVSGYTDAYSIISWTDNANILGFEYSIFPKTWTSSQGVYTCNGFFGVKGLSSNIMTTGGSYVDKDRRSGMVRHSFFMEVNDTYTNQYTGCRLMVLPPSRLSAA